jgi:tRNA nucleotidyltransferase (CCA-adding enzyme)
MAAMKIYLVGGAVRDKLLGLPVKERDWVVVGATPAQMLALGYKQVGKDFPVFLHPETHEEYALARTERKTGPGYKGFVVHADTDVTLEEDLQRRDLTINAIAEAPDGSLIDPYNGQRDLDARLLRHVAPAFTEDPVRILRVARFAARFAAQGFHVAEATQALMCQMVASGEVDALVPERVWMELARALAEAQPARFFEVLRDCAALARLMPELDALFGVPQPPAHHPEIDTGVHALMVLQAAAELTADTRVRFAALLHDLGKGGTPPSAWPRHIGHEARSVQLVEQLCARLKVPNDFRELAVLVARYHTHCHRAAELRAATLLEVLEALGAFRRSERFEQFLLACVADARGRTGHEQETYPQADLLRRAQRAAAQVTAQPFVEQGLTGVAIADAVRKARVRAIEVAR